MRWLEAFSTPPADYRPAPFVILNDEYEPGRGEEQLTRLLESLARAGYGGAFLHAREGLMTEYLSPRWFELIRHCVAECLRLGLVPHLYDENSYPSGFAGGHVAARVPEARCRYVTCQTGRGSTPPPALALHRWDGSRPGELLPAGELPSDTDWIAFVSGEMGPMIWHGETAYPSLLDPRTADAFLQTTHEAYRRELGDLWPRAASIFTDEPHLPGSGHGPWSAGLHLTPYILGQFRFRRGYDLRPHLAELFFDVGNFRRTRYHFYDLCHRLWMENWALPLESWCHRNGIRLTGHYLEHDWPCPYATPGHVHLLAHMDWPGTDVLMGYPLKGHDFLDLQAFDPAPAGEEPHGLLFLRQVHSVANQLGKERVVNEAWGAGGHESTPEDWMRIGRWLIVHGVNLVVPHSSWDTIRGARKTDCPQNFAPQSPWFAHLKPLNDELTRLCWVANQGECVNRLLVVDSLTTGFCAARKADALAPEAAYGFGGDLYDDYTEFALLSTQAIRRAAGRFAQDLSDAQVDYDLADEYVMEEFGSALGRSLRVGRRTYEVVALMPGLVHLRSETVGLLESYLSAGGHLLAVRSEEFFVDGEPTSVLQKWRDAYPGKVEWHDDADALLSRIREIVPPRLQFDGAGAGLAHLRRVIDEGEIYLIVNSGPGKRQLSAELATGYREISALCARTGGANALTSRPTKNGRSFDLIMEPCSAAVLFAGNVPLGSEMAGDRIAEDTSAGKVELLEVLRTTDNVLVVDICSVEIQGTPCPAETVAAAKKRYWQAHGLESNGWHGVIQYRDQVMARDRTMAAESGGIVRYSFEIGPGVDRGALSLAVDVPEAWEVFVNGSQVFFDRGATFRDPRILRASIGDLVRDGENEVVLVGRPFSVRQEIEAIYLLGNFSCEAQSLGFRVVPESRLSWGSWKEQGMPFYDGEVTYRICLPEGTRELRVPREIFQGSVVSLHAAGRLIGRIYEAPWAHLFHGPAPRELELRVTGLPKNLFGPWHDSRHRWGFGGPGMWVGDDVRTRPAAGWEYDLLDLGLLASPTVLL